MFRSIQDFYADNPVSFPNIQDDTFRELPIDHRLLLLI